MRVLKNRFLRAVKTRRVNVFLLFVFLAFIILLLSKLSRDYTNTITFNITQKNVPEETVILKDSSHKLKISLNTYGFKWLKYYFITPHLEIDFDQDVTITDSLFVWNRTKGFSTINNQFEKTEKIISVNPEELIFKYDKNAVKKVPIIANLDIKYSPGYNTLDENLIDPDSVKLIGPSSLLEKVDYIATKPYKTDNVKFPILKTLKLDIDSLDQSIKLDIKEIKLKSSVEKFTEGTLRVPIEVINVPSSITLTHFPKTINVYYFTSLKAFKNIKSKDFKVICDYRELANNDLYLIPKLVKQPSAIKRIRLQQQHVEYIITE